MNINVRDGARILPANLRNLDGKLSRPVALLTSSFSSNFRTSLVQQLPKEKVLLAEMRKLSGWVFTRGISLVAKVAKLTTLHHS